MKKIIQLVAGITLLSAYFAHADILWSSPAADLSVSPYNMSAGWVVCVYHDTDGDTGTLSGDFQTSWMDFADGTLSGDAAVNDDVPIASWNTTIVSALGVLQFDTSIADGWEQTWGGSNVYMIAFNASSVVVADNYFVFNSSGSGAPTIQTLHTEPNELLIASANGYWAESAPPTEPDITISGNGNEIADGDTTPSVSDGTDFGSADIDGVAITNIFTVLNEGDADLLITNVEVSGSAFTVLDTLSSVTLTNSESDTFRIVFDPAVTGVVSGMVTVNSSDPDTENPYTFAIQGEGTNAVPTSPDITVSGNGQEIANNDTTPSSTDDTDFGDVVLGEAKTNTFTVLNDGDADLLITNVAISAADGFTLLDTLTDTTLTPSQSTTFDVVFAPTEGGGESVEPVDSNFTNASYVASTSRIRRGNEGNNGWYYEYLASVAPATMDGEQGAQLSEDGGDRAHLGQTFSDGELAGTYQLRFRYLVEDGGTPADADDNILKITLYESDTSGGNYATRMESIGDGYEPQSGWAGDASIIGHLSNFVVNTEMQDDKTWTTYTSPSFDLTDVSGETDWLFLGFTVENVDSANGEYIGLDDVELITGGGGGGTGEVFSTVTINNSDSANNPYTFDLRGNGVTSAPPVVPDITISGNGNEIADGDTTPSVSDDTDFGSADVSGGAITNTFTVLNEGDADLVITNVQISGNAAFTLLDTLSSVTLTNSESDTFRIVFNPASVGTAAGTVTVNNSDPDAENPYTFAIEGTGTSSAQIETSATSLIVPENGTNTFDVRLTSDPGASVTVSVARTVGDSNIVVQGGATLVFSSGDFGWKAVTLIAEDDMDAIDDDATITCSGDGMTNVNVTATEDDDDIEPTIGVHLRFDFGEEYITSETGWNNVTNVDVGLVVDNAVDTNGTATVIDLEITESMDTLHHGGTLSGLYPNDMRRDQFTPINGKMKLTGLDTNNTYTLVLFGSRRWNTNYDTDYVIGSVTQYIDNYMNETNLVIFESVCPETDGSIEIGVNRVGTGRGVINVMEVIETVDAGGAAAMSMPMMSQTLVAAGEPVVLVQTVIEGNNLIGVSMEADTLGDLLGTPLLDADTVVLYNAETALYENYTAAEALTLTVPAGGAFWLQTAESRELTLSGMAVSAKAIELLEGLQIIANPIAEDEPLQTLGLSGTASDDVAACDKVSVLDEGVYRIYGLASDGLWYRADDEMIWTIRMEADELIEAGEGFWYDAQAPFTWYAE